VSVDFIEKMDQKCIVQFTVEDTGIGIPDDKKEAIFEKFYRLTSSYTGKYVGSGLGLNIVKQFLEEMDGQYDIKSELNKGQHLKYLFPTKSH